MQADDVFLRFDPLESVDITVEIEDAGEGHIINMLSDDDFIFSPNISPIIESRDAERVMQEIHEKYGFWVTPEYAADLIAFVDALILTGMSRREQAQEDPYRAGE